MEVKIKVKIENKTRLPKIDNLLYEVTIPRSDGKSNNVAQMWSPKEYEVGKIVEVNGDIRCTQFNEVVRA